MDLNVLQEAMRARKAVLVRMSYSVPLSKSELISIDDGGKRCDEASEYFLERPAAHMFDVEYSGHHGPQLFFTCYPEDRDACFKYIGEFFGWPLEAAI